MARLKINMPPHRMDTGPFGLGFFFQLFFPKDYFSFAAGRCNSLFYQFLIISAYPAQSTVEFTFRAIKILVTVF
jgi:hypothetical protein